MAVNLKKPGVIVLGGHVQGYGIVRIYGENNIPSVVIDTTKINIARHSKYCIDFYKCSYDDLLILLLDFQSRGIYRDWLLIPTDDYYVRILSKNKKELSKYFRVSVDDWEKIKLFFDKRNSYPLAHKAGVPIPITEYPKSLSEIREISKRVSYPCILKPAIMLDFYRTFKKKVFVCKNSMELEQNYLRALNILKPDELMVQEIIPGNNEHQYSVGIFFDRDKSYNYLVARRKRQHPIDFGNATTFAETVDIPLLVDYSHKILSEANFWGICEVEFKYDERDKKYKFLEVNPRTWKWHLISIGTGIPFHLSLYHFLYKEKPLIEKKYKECGWRDIITDIPTTIIIMLKRKIYIKSKTKNVVHAVINFRDLKPFLMQLLYLPYFIFKR